MSKSELGSFQSHWRSQSQSENQCTMAVNASGNHVDLQTRGHAMLSPYSVQTRLQIGLTHVTLCTSCKRATREEFGRKPHGI